MKKILTFLLQSAAFLTVFFAGSILNPFHLRWFITHPTPTSIRDFSPGGLLLACALYVLFLVVEALLKKLSEAAPVTTAAFLLALVLGLLAKFGFATHDFY